GGLITVFKEFMPSDRPRGKNKLTALTLEFDEESGRYTQAIFKPSAGSVKAVFYTDARLDVHESADAALKRNDGAVRKAVNGLEKAEIFICVSPAREFARSFKVCDRLEESIILKEIPVDIVTLSEDIFSRNKSILETVELRNKSVAMIGLGSMGSSIALELARSGVGNFTLIDLDRVSAANVCRHACGVTEVGKFKSYAVRDRILKINPLATVTASISDLTEDLEFAIKLVQGCDLIIVTTDTLSSRRVSNYLGILMKAPVIFAGVFERAGGCRIFKMVPGTDCACMECHQIGTFDERPGAVTYSAAKDPRDLTIQPGLSVDISIAAELAAKMAIEELREDKSGAMPYDLIITRNYSPEAGVNEPVRFMCARNGNIKKNPDCPVCGENSVMEI
ncbi:MAG TPA: ThiF family adenylyltransferase, partial [Candidatus Wallbacteria bacterium]|nr:ThiF family adenylyltransferase [Candidatus Wallbacteria bacterium]